MRRKRTEIANPLFSNTFHITQRCVRKDALLHDQLPSRGRFRSRRDAMLNCLSLLASAFAIDILRFSIMSNHIHLVLRNRPEIVQKWSDREVVERWFRVCPGYCRALADFRNKPGEPIVEKEIEKVLRDKNRVAELRLRLSSISYFMWALSNYSSKLFNLIDGQSGCFWQSRYKIKQLLDDLSLLVCGVYVDLNPIRAGAATSPEECLYTSAFFNLKSAQIAAEIAEIDLASLPDSFFAPVTIPLAEADRNQSKFSTRASDNGFASMTQHEYFILLDLIGRLIIKEHTAAIPAKLPPIFERLNLNWESMAELVNSYEELFKVFVGSRESLETHATKLGGRKLRCPAEKTCLLP
jgi:REP element-mobilizing transposase RayT